MISFFLATGSSLLQITLSYRALKAQEENFLAGALLWQAELYEAIVTVGGDGFLGCPGPLGTASAAGRRNQLHQGSGCSDSVHQVLKDLEPLGRRKKKEENLSFQANPSLNQMGEGVRWQLAETSWKLLCCVH